MSLDLQTQLLAGRYWVRGTIGIGGMARVLLADDERLGRPVAIKRLHADSPEDAALRLAREARLGASLNHPNLVAVYDIETDAESVLVVMEYVEGRTLGDSLFRGPLPAREATRVVAEVAAALDHVHAGGVVHRDVKPGNILLRDDGAVKLADLGIAYALESTHITQSGTVLGSVRYMAPEQLEGHEVGPAADVYSLAAVAYEALSGKRARAEGNPLEVAYAVATNPAPDLREAWPDAPEAMAVALMRGMARDPAERQHSAGELAGELQAGQPARLAASLLDGTAAPLPRHPRAPRRRAAMAGVAALAAVLAGAGVALIGGGEDGPRGGERAAAETAKAKTVAKAKAKTPPAKSTGPARATRRAPAPASPPPPQPAPAGAAALNDRGFALLRQGDPAAAIPVLQRAVAAGGSGLTHAYALFNLANALRLAGRPAEAIPILERRLQIPNQKKTVKEELKAARRAAKH